MSLTRRELVKYGLSASGVFLLPLQFPKKALADSTSTETSTKTAPWSSFKTPLTIPPVLLPHESDNKDNIDYYEIVMSKGNQQFAGRSATYEFWGYNGIFPGPTIKQRQDRQAEVSFVNKLGTTNIGRNGCPQAGNPEDIKAVVHLHGMPSLPQYDGYAEDYIHPNQYKQYIYPNNRAATFWYHDHQLARTMRNVGMGLVGMWIVQDDLECDLNLPEGKYDVPLIFQHPPFTWQAAEPTVSEPDKTYIKCENGTISYAEDNPPTLINGVYQPLMQVDTHKYRFRLLNATAYELYTLALVSYDQKSQQSVDESIIVVGTDSGLTHHPVSTSDLLFAMADRYEIIIDFNNRPIGSKMALVDRDIDGVDTPLICFEVANVVTDNSVVPYTLRPYRPVPPDIASPDHPPDEVFLFDFSGITSCDPTGAGAINGKVWDSSRIDAQPPLGSWQKWRLINGVGADHPVHIHLLDFQIVHRLDQAGNKIPLPPYEQDRWKDVFNLGPYETVDIVGEFGPHLGKYMMHCHNLNHEDCDMMTQFEVVDPEGKQQGDDPVTSAPAVNLPSGWTPLTPVYSDTTDLCSP